MLPVIIMQILNGSTDCVVESPRTRGRQHVAQGESASPGYCSEEAYKPAYSRAAAHWSSKGDTAPGGFAVACEYAGAWALVRHTQGSRASVRHTQGSRASVRHTQGSRTRPGLHAFAREYAGAWASVRHTQGSRTRPGLHAFAREYAGLCGSVRVRGLRQTAVGGIWKETVMAPPFFKGNSNACAGLPLRGIIIDRVWLRC